MSCFEIASEIGQLSIESRTGCPLAEARLSDRGRVGVIFQAAALLSHLEAAGWGLDSEWRELRIDTDGLVGGARAKPSLGTQFAQESLIDLVEVLFGTRDRIDGKGQAKQLASRSLRRWQRCQSRLPADRIVTELLDAADFLWQPAYAGQRRVLVAELSVDADSRLVVAGRATFATYLLARNSDRSVLEDLMAQPDARSLWLKCRGRRGREPQVMCRLDKARQLHFRGRWRQSLDEVSGLHEPAAQILRADCLRFLGRTGSARKVLDSLSPKKGLSREQSRRLTEVSALLYMDSGKTQTAMSLVTQHRLGSTRRERLGLELLAGELAARCGDWQAVGRCLSSVERQDRGATESSRWQKLRFKWTCARGDLGGAEKLDVQSLIRSRRLIPRIEAAEMWRQVASARLERGDLKGAEKAAGHALRLVETIDDSKAVAIVRWLADLRIRQGQLLGVEKLLQSDCMVSAGVSSQEELGTEELRARMDLVRGQPMQALGRLEALLARQASTSRGRCQRQRILAARALGWLGRGAEARELLDDAGDPRCEDLEREELPALWALAGDWSRAREVVANDAIGRHWGSLLGSGCVSRESWEALNSLGAYRSARLVFDCQILMPGKVPQCWLDRAVKILRRVGAHSFAERLDRTREGSWKALETYWTQSSDRGLEIGELFASAGYFDARLEWRSRNSSQILVFGSGGTEELKAERQGGHLVLSARTIDPVVRALFTLAVRDFKPEIVEPSREASRVRGILGESDTLRSALDRLERLAGSEVPVLIQGETGTGKELAARQLHHLSPRAIQPLVTVNCAALSETLLLSDLFGHVRGAFTGADRDRAGVFEAARGGTVLLDEIGDLPLSAQGKLLRVLQEGEVRRVGESLPRKIDIRIVAATHRDLRSMVEERAFRTDLYFRLNVGCLTLPPLRDRQRDVVLLADHFLERSGHTLTPRARQSLLGHHWPGNVRELRNVLQVAAALNDGPVIDLAQLELPDMGTERALGYHHQVEEFRRGLIRDALAASNGHQSAAAKRLAVSRQALSYLVRRFGLQ